MAAPKPWESSIAMSSQPLTCPFNPMNNNLGLTSEQPQIQGPAPPPPPRGLQQAQQQQQQQQQLGLYSSNSYLNPYSYNNPYQTGGFYNNYRLSPYGMPSNMPMSNFSQLAMEESRGAFSSVETVIHAFRSISIMLESTFTSVYSSFRAVTDVFDQFTRLRTELTAIYPLVLLWRFLKHLYQRLLRILHLRQATHGSTEETWSTIYQSLQQTRTPLNGQTTASSSSSSLMVALFFIVSFGTPMLMLKFLNSMIKKRQAASNWLEQDTNQARVLALYDYTARNSDELSFQKGTTIFLAPMGLQSTTSHWFLGSIDRIHSGLFPANYVQPIRQQTPSSINLHPQTPFNATTTTTVAPLPTPPSVPSTSTVTNIPPSIFHTEEQPTLS